MNPIERDALEFGRLLKQGDWRLGLLVARNVKRGKAGRPPAEIVVTTAISKVSAREFGRMSGTTADRVLRHLDAWERAADAGHVPHAADLQPDTEHDLDAEKLPAWSDFYDASNSYGRPRTAQPPLKAAQLRQVIGSLTPSERVEVGRQVMAEPEIAEEVVKDSKVRDAVDAEEKRVFFEAQKRRKEAAEQRLQPTPLSQFFWSLVGKLSEWTRDMKLIREEAGSLASAQRPEVIDRLTLLRDEAQRCIDAIESLGHEDDDVIEGNVTQIRGLEGGEG